MDWKIANLLQPDPPTKLYIHKKYILVQIINYLKLINSRNKFLQLIDNQFPK